MKSFVKWQKNTLHLMILLITALLTNIRFAMKGEKGEENQ